MRQRITRFLWNGQSRRPRLPWRILGVILILLIISLGFSVALPFLQSSLAGLFGLLAPTSQATAAAGNLVFLASQAVIYLGTVYLAARFVDRRRLRDYGLHIDRGWVIDLLFGLVLGAALMTLIFLVQYVAGWIEITGTFRIVRSDFSFWPWFGWALLTMVGIGVTEELLLRGYLITNLAEGFTWFDRIGTRGAVLVALVGSSLVFGVSHLLNPNAGVASTAGIFFAAIMLGSAYILSGELAIPIGLHVTWNLFQGPVYGFPVSGLNFGLSVVAIDQAGPAAYTGGGFGPEAGLLGVIATVVGIGLILVWIRWREGQIRLDPSVVTPELRSMLDVD